MIRHSAIFICAIPLSCPTLKNKIISSPIKVNSIESIAFMSINNNINNIAISLLDERKGI